MIDLEMYYGPEEEWDEQDDPTLAGSDENEWVIESTDEWDDDGDEDDDFWEDFADTPYHDPVDPPDYSHYQY